MLFKLRPWFLGLMLSPALIGNAQAQPPNPLNVIPGGDGRSLGERIGDGRKGPKIFPQSESSTSRIGVITPPSIDSRSGVVYSGTTSGGGRGDMVPNATSYLVKKGDGKWWWRNGYRNTYTGPTPDRLAEDSIQRAKQLEEERAIEESLAFRIDDQGRTYSASTLLGQARRVRNQYTGRTAWRFDIPNGWTLIRYDGTDVTERHLYKKTATASPTAASGAQTTALASPGISSGSPSMDAPRPLATAFTPEARPDSIPYSQGGTSASLASTPALVPSAALATTTEPAPGDGGSYANNIGIYYERVVYADGTFGARLTRDALPGTPAATLGLEKGDTIFALDGLRFRTPEDVLNHRAQTTIDFVNVRTNGAQNASLTLP